MTTAKKAEENKSWPQFLAVFTALMCMFASGIHFGWPSPSLPRIFSDEYPFDVTEEEASYVAVIGPVGDIFGNIFASILVDLIGRQRTILLLGVPQIVSMTMIYLSHYSKALLYIARFIGGLSEGACFTILPIYICEVSEPRIRGALGASFSLSVMLGILFVNVVGTYVSLSVGALIYASFSVLFLVAFAPMPDSPYYLLMKERVDDARASLKRLRARQDVEDELKELSKDVSRQMSEGGSFSDLFTVPSNRSATVLMIVLRFLQQFSGASCFTIYAQLLLKESTDAIPQEWGAFLMVTVQAMTTLVGVLLVDQVGRKPLLLTSVAGCCVSLLVNAVFFTFRDYSDLDVGSITLLPLIALVVSIASFAIGLGCAVNLLGGELFSATLKAKAICVMNLVFSVTMFASTKYYQFTADNYSMAIPFWTFGLIQMGGLVYCYKVVPETKNKTLEQIQQELKGNK